MSPFELLVCVGLAIGGASPPEGGITSKPDAPKSATAQTESTTPVPPQRLPPVEVPWSKDETRASSGDAEPAAASLADVDATATQSRIAVAPRTGEAKSAVELASSAPGVASQEAGGFGQRAMLSLRGSSPTGVLVTLDGVPLAGPGQSADLSRIPAAFLERIDVVRGAAARSMPGGLGGAIDVVTRAPRGTRLAGEWTGGPSATALLSTAAGARIGPGDALLMASGLTTAGDYAYQVNRTARAPGSAPASARRENNDARQVSLLARYRSSSSWGGFDVVAHGLTEAKGIAGTVENPTRDARADGITGSLSARLRRPLDGGGELRSLAFVRAEELTLRGGSFGPQGFTQGQLGGAAELSVSRVVGGRHGLSGQLSLGVDSLGSPGLARAVEGRVGAMLVDDLLLLDGRLLVSPSARIEFAGPFLVISPKLGASLRVSSELELLANVGRASRPPSFLERHVVQGTLRPNPSLRPEEATAVDVGVSLRGRALELGATWFLSSYRNLIAYEYSPPGLARPLNLGRALITGAELEAQVRPHRFVTVEGAYTMTVAENRETDPRFQGKPLPYRPLHRLGARIRAGPKELSARSEVVAQSEQTRNRSGTLLSPARVLVNAGLSSTFVAAPAMTVSLEVKNLLDVQAQDLDGYPLPPRAAFVTLAVSWDPVEKPKDPT